MKFFLGAEMFASVADKIRPVRNQAESKIKKQLEKNDYGNGVVDWGHIIVVNPQDLYDEGFLPEIKKYKKNTGEVELRLHIDYIKMLKASEKELFKLICNSIIEGIDIVQKELSVDNFDFEAFRNDLVSLFKKEGWV
jgi:hypothetical protein